MNKCIGCGKDLEYSQICIECSKSAIRGIDKIVLSCPNCGSKLKASDRGLLIKNWYCKNCDVLFSIS